ncbi:MAG: cell division topological specificity factor MinE [Vampirovibrionales bacterium]|nr:cell division topological specificity factor MinE [Vampirovibrionales bacterium]
MASITSPNNADKSEPTQNSNGPLGWLVRFLNLDASTSSGRAIGLGLAKKDPRATAGEDARSHAVNRLKLVLMHDRTQISPDTLAQMRDELVQVISKYVEIDTEALELNFEGDSNTIALMANIPVLRGKNVVVAAS